MKYLIDQARLYLAELLIFWAMRIAPAGHPDSKAIIEAAYHVASRSQSS